MAYRNEHLFITVPKNDQGYQDYDIGIDESENFLSYRLSPEEYNARRKSTTSPYKSQPLKKASC